MSHRTSKIWGWRQRFIYRLNDVVAILCVIALVAILIIHGFIKMRLSVSKTLAILNSDDLGDAPEPFHVLKYILCPEQGCQTFEGYIGRKIQSMSKWPITNKDGIITANMKLAMLSKAVEIDCLPAKFQKGPLLISMLSWSSFLKVGPSAYEDPYLLELLVATDNFPEQPLQKNSLDAESIRIIDTYSKYPDRWMRADRSAHDTIDPLVSLKTLLHDLAHADLTEQERFKKLEETITLLIDHRLDMEPCQNDLEIRVLQELLDNGLGIYHVRVEDRRKVKAMNIAAEGINLHLLQRLGTKQQVDHIAKTPFRGYSEDDHICILGFLSSRPKLFERLAGKWNVTPEMVANYIRSGASRKPIFFDHPSFIDNIPMLVADYPDVALSMINNHQFDGRTLTISSALLSEAEKLPELPAKITKLSALSLIERARRKGCFYSLAQLKRRDINTVLQAALTPDQYTFIRKKLMVSSNNADLSKLPDSVLEDVCMEELGL
ncbi:hypothetical protein [Pseudomonas sp. S1(2024)]|uniref:hypothetical protein n=1 Tax=Pseudomonas sp. S1(2024) TaxID=3390191 RepID=UPI003978CFFC